MDLGFNFTFKNYSLSIFLEDTFFGQGYFKDDMIMLDLDSNNDIVFVSSSSSNVINDFVK